MDLYGANSVEMKYYISRMEISRHNDNGPIN